MHKRRSRGNSGKIIRRIFYTGTYNKEQKEEVFYSGISYHAVLKNWQQQPIPRYPSGCEIFRRKIPTLLACASELYIENDWYSTPLNALVHLPCSLLRHKNPIIINDYLQA